MQGTLPGNLKDKLPKISGVVKYKFTPELPELNPVTFFACILFVVGIFTGVVCCFIFDLRSAAWLFLGFGLGAAVVAVFTTYQYKQSISYYKNHMLELFSQKLEQQKVDSENTLQNGYEEAYQIILDLRSQLEKEKEKARKPVEPLIPLTKSRWRSIDDE